jgi:hypothetical protein
MSFGIPIRNGLSLGLRPVATLATDLSSFDPGPPWIVLTSSGIAYLVYQVVQDSSGTAYTVSFLVKSSNGVDYYIAPYEPSLYLDYTIPSSGVPGVQPGYYLVDNGFGVLTQTTFSSLITFSRASNATRYSPTGQLEYAPHNLLLQSQTFDNASWTKTNSSITANAATAPDGTLTGDKLIGNSGLNGAVSQSISFTSGTSYAVSFFAQKAEFDIVQLRVGSSAFAGTTGNRTVDFNLTTGSVSSVGSSISSASITAVGNGWYRCVSIVIPTSTASDSVFIRISNTGDGTSGIYIWGAQFAVGPNALDYTPTTTAVVYGPRFDYDPTTLAAKGLLIEEQRTNSLRNNTMVGAVAGTPGTAPTNWSVSASGLTQEIVAIGTENGITYIDLKLSGTATSNNIIVSFDTTTGIAALNGQTWTESIYIKQVAAVANANSYTLRMSMRDAGGAGLAQFDVTIVPTTTLTRYTNTATLNNASTAFLVPQLRIGLTIGNSYDFTLRIGLPQLEQGAFATSVIPTTTAATTRSADIASIGTLSPWYNATEGTLYAEFQWETTYARNNSPLFRFDDGTNNNLIQLGFRNVSPTAPGSISSRLSGGATAETTTGTVSTNDGLRHKFAGAYAALELAFSADAQAAGTAVITGVPTVNIARLGASNTGIATQYAIYIRRITYTPRRLTNAELQSLTS